MAAQPAPFSDRRCGVERPSALAKPDRKIRRARSYGICSDLGAALGDDSAQDLHAFRKGPTREVCAISYESPLTG